jgi:uncharacterized iron-regulated protein
MTGCRWSGAAVIAAAMLAGCALPPSPPADVPAGERIVEVATGRTLSRASLLARLRDSDYVMLGELHDNALHHQRRGELLQALGAGVPVVAEHLTFGLSVVDGPALLPRLEAAGFDPKGWRWPLHEALFAPATAPGHDLRGGNAPREQARAVARGGEAALPAAFAPLLRAAPLPEAAQAALDADLVQGHCGMLAGERLVSMRWAQRLRDASMWTALQAAAQAGRPAVLVAGNGHVRDDYGVPQLARQQQPGARVTSVGFVDGATPVAGQPYEVVWQTAAPSGRVDPCAAPKPQVQPQARPAATAASGAR